MGSLQWVGKAKTLASEASWIRPGCFPAIVIATGELSMDAAKSHFKRHVDKDGQSRW